MQNIGTSLAFCINKTGFGWEVCPNRQVGRHSTIITWRQQTEPKKQKQGTHSRNPSLTPNLSKLLLSFMRVPCLAALDSTAVDPVRTHTQPWFVAGVALKEMLKKKNKEKKEKGSGDIAVKTTHGMGGGPRRQSFFLVASDFPFLAASALPSPPRLEVSALPRASHTPPRKTAQKRFSNGRNGSWMPRSMADSLK